MSKAGDVGLKCDVPFSCPSRLASMLACSSQGPLASDCEQAVVKVDLTCMVSFMYGLWPFLPTV